MASYGDLTAEDVRRVMPAASRGADDPLLEDYLEEKRLWLARHLGGSPPEGDLVLRGILRDLAASSAMRKLAGNDEERRGADGLRDDAQARLDSYAASADPGGGAPTVEQWTMPW